MLKLWAGPVVEVRGAARAARLSICSGAKYARSAATLSSVQRSRAARSYWYLHSKLAGFGPTYIGSDPDFSYACDPETEGNAMTTVALEHLPDDELARCYYEGRVSDDEIVRVVCERVSPHELALIEAFVRELLHAPIGQLMAEASVCRSGALASEGAPVVGGFFDDIGNAFKGAYQSVASVVHHPPGWLATAFPLFGTENQRYWAQKLGGSTGAQLYDAGVNALASKYLGPQGPALVEAYNKVTEDASQGKLNAQEILAHAPQIAKLAIASKQGPEAFRAAIAETNSAVKGTKGMRAHTGQAYVGADGHSYPEIASRAVLDVHTQNPSPVYGYLRTGAQQKIYLYQTLEDAQGWFSSLAHAPFDYAAVFVATDVSHPVPGLESFGHSHGNPTVGNWVPFLLGLPAGALGGYFLRRWQEDHPGQMIPGIPPGKLPGPSTPAPAKTSGDWVGGPWLNIEEPSPYAIGGPWLDLVGPNPSWGYTIGGPWVDIVGAQADDRAGSWLQTKALIQSAISEVNDLARVRPAAAYVWSLDPPSASPSSRVVLEGTSYVEAFGSPAEALDYMRQKIQTPHVALALFDRRSSHWPNPTNWTKSNDPEYASVIAQQISKTAPTRTVGSYVGAVSPMDSALESVRTRAKALATAKAGNAVGVIHSADGRWHVFSFSALDDAIDWLATATREKALFTYAAAFDKGSDGTAYFQDEEISGIRRPRPTQPIVRRDFATATGA
jgi:hypothetical protein